MAPLRFQGLVTRNDSPGEFLPADSYISRAKAAKNAKFGFFSSRTLRALRRCSGHALRETIRPSVEALLGNLMKPMVLLSLLLLAPSVASAHAYLVKSLPAGRATLFASPAKIQLWFNERLEPKYSSVSVLDPNGKRVDADDAHVLAEDPKQLTIGVKQLPAGRYTVKFRVLSVDGHVVEQSFPFTIRETKN